MYSNNHLVSWSILHGQWRLVNSLAFPITRELNTITLSDPTQQTLSVCRRSWLIVCDYRCPLLCYNCTMACPSPILLDNDHKSHLVVADIPTLTRIRSSASTPRSSQRDVIMTQLPPSGRIERTQPDLWSPAGVAAGSQWNYRLEYICVIFSLNVYTRVFDVWHVFTCLFVLNVYTRVYCILNVYTCVKHHEWYTRLPVCLSCKHVLLSMYKIYYVQLCESATYVAYPTITLQF